MPRSVKEIGLALLLTGLGLIILLSSLPKNQTGVFSEGVGVLIKPFYSTIQFVKTQLGGFISSYVALVSVNRENEILKTENARLRIQNSDLIEKANENKRLKRFLGFKKSLEHSTLLAQVIGMDASGVYQTVFINKGKDDGITPNMPVVAADGVVGKIMAVYGNMSQVGLMTDPAVSIDARIQRTRDRGVITGDLSASCLLRYLNRKASVQQGDTVITSGLDGVFPKGLTIGVVQSVHPGQHGLFWEAIVQPSANLNELEEALVIVNKENGFHVEPGIDGPK